MLLHGGTSSRKLWTRNIDPLAARFTVHALDFPSYGASAPVSRETSGAAYLDLVHQLSALGRQLLVDLRRRPL